MIPVGPFQGRLARDPEFTRMGQAQFPKWAVTLVVDEPRWNGQTRQQEVHPIWVRLEAVGTMAESLDEERYAQGDEIVVVGRLAQFTAGEGDQKQTKTHVTPLIVQATRRKSQRPPTSPPPRQDAAGGSPDDPWAATPVSAEPPF